MGSRWNFANNDREALRGSQIFRKTSRSHSGCPNEQNTNICCESFRNKFCPCDRRHCSGSLLLDLGATSITSTGGPSETHKFSEIIVQATSKF